MDSTLLPVSPDKVKNEKQISLSPQNEESERKNNVVVFASQSQC
jgi:hypothetical protein